MPTRSDTFDCDDDALFMYQRFTQLGIKVTPMVGDLNKTGEQFNEINHIWLLVNIGSFNIPIDWGTTWMDGQHREGYPVSYQQLLAFVEQDKTSVSAPAK
ncbi:MAG: hypothetical protein PHY28_09695 [Dehalococcoidales bacterium]|nr:hypothetical protein [Dehalococcoidales bacterium]